VHIYIDPVKLNNYGLSLNAVQGALAGANINTPLGDDNLDGMYYNIRVDEQFESIEDIEKVLLTTGTGELIFLMDVAQIVDTHEDPEETAAMYLAGDDESRSYGSVNITVDREDGADVVGSSERVRQMLEDEQGKLYPGNLTIHISYDQADDVTQDLKDVTENALSGLVVVVIVLFLFIGFSESLIVAFVIPLSMLSALAVMSYSGITLNSLSILGLIVSLGLLVDNAIVIMENVDRMRHLGLDRVTASKVGTNQVAVSVFAATLTTVAAFVPLTMIPGMMGSFIKSIPQAVIITILASLVISLMITPTLCSRFLPKQKKKSKYGDKLWVRIGSVILVIVLCGYAFRVDGEFGVIAIGASIVFGSAMFVKQFMFHNKSLEEAGAIKWYEKTLRSIITSKAKRFIMLGVGVALLVAALATFPTGILKVEMMPDDDPTTVEITMEAPQGTSLETMENITAEAEQILFDMPEVESFSMTVGGNQKNTSSINAELIDEKLRDKDGMEVLEEVREKVEQIAGAQITVKASAQGPPTSDYDISVSFLGEDMDEVKATAEEHLAVLNTIEGVVGPRLNVQDAAPQIQFDINNNKAKALGLTASDIAGELRSYINGVTATTVKFDNTEVDVIIKMDNEEITSTDQLNNLFITLKNGDKIPVSVVAQVVEVEGLSEIIHEDFDRVIKLQADLKTGYNSNEVLNTFRFEAANIMVPETVELTYGGESEDIAENFGNLGNSMLLAIILVYGILAVQFNSITQPFVIVMTIPMATIGVIFGLLVTGNNFGFYAFMGLVSLVGIAVNDAIVLVDYINYLRSVGKNLTDALVEAGKTRFIPVFSTTITTCGGILPLAVKNPYYAQLGYSLIFGLMVATVLTLVFIPIFYSLIEGRKIKKQEGKDERAMAKALADVEV